MVESDLMFALAETAAIFVAILAGFYTTKLITIASDKKRLLISIGEKRNELDWRNKKAEDLKSKIYEIEKETYDSRLRVLQREATSPAYFSEINTYEDLKNLYEKNYGKIPEYVSTELKKISGEVLKKVQNVRTKWSEYLKKGMTPPAEETEQIGFMLNSSTHDKVTAFVAAESEQKVYDDYDSELSNIERLEDQLRSYQRDVNSIVYPRHLVFGYLSFVAFAFLGVVIPFTHNWWAALLGEFSDTAALLAFFAGLVISFSYILKEMLDVLKT